MQLRGRVVSTSLTLLLMGIAGCDDAQLSGGRDRNADPQASTSVESSASSGPFLWSDSDMPPGDQQADLEDCQEQMKELGIGSKGPELEKLVWSLECMAQKGWLLPGHFHELTP